MNKYENNHITIKDIALRSNVSIATVSRVMNGVGKKYSRETEEKILKVAKELNYYPDDLAKGLKNRRTNNIAFLTPQIDDYYSLIYLGMQQAAKESGYSVHMLSSNYDIDQENLNIKKLRAQRYDGIVIATGLLDEKHEIELNTSFPIVLVDYTYDDVPYVCTNYEEITCNTTKYLIAQGHKNIAFLSSPLKHAGPKYRYDGYKHAFEENNLTANENLAFFVDFLEPTNYAKCYSFIKSIARTHIFSALLCVTDLAAMVAIRAFHELGLRVPQDIAVIGFDDLPVSQYFIPSITTISQNKYEMGYQSTQMLIDIINGKNVESKIIDSTLCIRSSTESGQKDSFSNFPANTSLI